MGRIVLLRILDQVDSMCELIDLIVDRQELSMGLEKRVRMV